MFMLFLNGAEEEEVEAIKPTVAAFLSTPTNYNSNL